MMQSASPLRVFFRSCYPQDSMLRNRTVFILGAGASRPYGLPSGYELVGEVIQVLKSKKTDLNNYWKFLHKDIDGFIKAIEGSVPQAIDDLLVQRREFLEIGKVGIAYALVQYEREEMLFRRENNDNWYGYFFEHLKDLPAPVNQGRYSFITFNYDRSLEHYLLTSADNFYGDSNDKRKQAIRDIPVLHIHGHLGLLPSQGGDLPYHPTDSRTDVNRISKNLKLTDEEADTEVMARAHVLIQEAHIIRFLGFGYHETNLKKLELDSNVGEREYDIAGTAVGLKAAEIRQIEAKHRIMLDKDGRTIVDFFRDKYPLNGKVEKPRLVSR